ncbi:uncharacterized protein J4E79_009644 [Alternaria viburni]|uniref:uncharacterized protein n=1 Tax=Alternaria viburni TaxID=566460 RepID=UPI0020C51F6B|nr:uncharacterized protein J4E79_009644 [Alternaria viburni]KAI4649799.1 hypothetical protein J4E79_009644 [Alternaria viburni]
MAGNGAPASAPSRLLSAAPTVKHGINIKYPVAMQAYDPQDMFFAKSSIKSWTKEESAKEYDRLAGAYMALSHEHISILVDQDSKEKNARRQVVDSRRSLANGAQMLLWNSEAAFQASKAIAGRICQPSTWTDPQTQTQYTGKAPGSFTPQEAQHILNQYKNDCINDLKGATLAATGANLEEFCIDETVVTQAYDLPGDRSWFEKISDNWKDAARDVLVDSSMTLGIIEEAPPRRQNVMFDPLMARDNLFDAAQSDFPLTDPMSESLTEPARDQVIPAPKDEKKKRKLGPEVAETELKRRIERADTYWVLDVTTEDIQRTLSFATGRSHFTQYNIIYPPDAKPLDDDPSVAAWTKKLATDCFIPRSSVVMNMAMNSMIKEEGDVYKQDKNKEGEWTDGAKVGLNVAKYTEDFMGLTSA